jgi:glycosyltransferase involved in cell wall biosynthesis
LRVNEVLSSKKILFVVNVDWFFISHRLPIALKAIENGYEVHIATTITNKLDFLKDKGLIVHSLSFHRSSLVTVTLEFIKTLQVIYKVSPDILHLVTIKPILLGGIAARIVRVPSVVYAISGLGFVFINNGFLALKRQQLVSYIYRISLNHFNRKVIFQNIDDKAKLSRLARISSKDAVLIQGSGIDLSLYVEQKIPNGVPVVLMAARLLVDKGVREFVLAAEMVSKSKQKARFILVGDVDPLNPASIKEWELEKWKREGVVELWGYQDNMERVISSSTIAVLPSYREGLPKFLIEAAACGRAIITTDVPGCRDAIEHELTGILVPVKNPDAIADSVLRLLDNMNLCREMGREGRKRAEIMFDLNSVVTKHINVYNELLCRIKTK